MDGYSIEGLERYGWESIDIPVAKKRMKRMNTELLQCYNTKVKINLFNGEPWLEVTLYTD